MHPFASFPLLHLHSYVGAAARCVQCQQPGTNGRALRARVVTPWPPRSYVMCLRVVMACPPGPTFRQLKGRQSLVRFNNLLTADNLGGFEPFTPCDTSGPSRQVRLPCHER